MIKHLLGFILSFSFMAVTAQTPKAYTSSEILLQIKKLDVLGAVLYIAAHPDDENTRLLAYLANEKLYRTGYLSLTRGDGGQNLIGDEQGIDLGLIRTQELLAARRIDGAEQFFTRAYDFGFCKSSDEALQTWGHDKILSDVVWVIRKFKPDVIITRFPGDSRAGHGQHSASALLAAEAFDAAADPGKFPEQLSRGVEVWQAKRIVWNTFNFGNTITQSEDQFKIDVGGFNPLLGKGYGEIAALSRSQHKSQGFGVAAQRGTVIEYFSAVKGERPVKDLMDGVDLGWSRAGADSISVLVRGISNDFNPSNPGGSISGLVKLYRLVGSMANGYWKTQKLKEIQTCIEAASGLFMDATANTQYAVEGDSVKVTATANNRSGLNIRAMEVKIADTNYRMDTIRKNENLSYSRNVFIEAGKMSTQPYWLNEPMDKGSFNVADPEQIGAPESQPPYVSFEVNIDGIVFTWKKPIRYKYTDPVRGELYQPLSIIPVADLSFEKDVYLLKEKDSTRARIRVMPNIDVAGELKLQATTEGTGGNNESTQSFQLNGITKDKPLIYEVKLPQAKTAKPDTRVHADISNGSRDWVLSKTYKRVINYDHIPSIVYQKLADTRPVYTDLKVDGTLVGYIPGAGDKVPQALIEMGYKVVSLTHREVKAGNLKQFDAIITGVRAYNVNDWMNDVYDELMDYVKEGGVLLAQYNTSNQTGPVKAKMAPYPFTISRNRITDEEAPVQFLLPDHPALNYPNKITPRDFEGWIQERSIYNADKIDSNYARIISMKDPAEEEQLGSLIIANYGKGRFVYTGLVFFRELPAGVPGAYRLFANLIAANQPGKMNKISKLNKVDKGR